MDKWLHILRFRWEEHLRGGMCNLEKKWRGMCSQKKTHMRNPSVEEYVAKIANFWTHVLQRWNVMQIY